MIKAEYIDGGKRVVIPAILWEKFKDVFEHIQLYELIQERKNQSPLHILDDVLAEEGLNRAELEDCTH